MKRVLQSLFMALAALAFLTGCTQKENQSITVGITASAIVDGHATLTVTLSQATAFNVVSVSLSASGNLASSLSFDRKVVVEAGEVSAQVPVIVSADNLPVGSYEAEISITSATGATVDTKAKSAKLSLVVDGPTTAVASIASYDPEFTDGTAKLTVTLSKALEEEATVTLATTVNAEEYPVVEDAALTYDKTLTFEPGKLSKTVIVTLDASQLSIGESVASIKIDQVSENLTISTTASQADILVEIVLPLNKRDDWSANYVGPQVVEEKEWAAINVSGMGAEGTFYIFIYSKGLVASYFDDDAEYVNTMAGYVHDALGTEKPYPIYEGDGPKYFNLAAGEYEIWLLGCDEDGELNGDYAQGENFLVEASEEAKAAFAQWLGEWKVTRGSNAEPDTWVISEDIEGISFFINGLDGGEGYLAYTKVKADYDFTNDAIILYAQTGLETITIQGADYDLGLYGMFDGTIYGGSYDIASIQKEGDTATITGMEQYDGSVCSGMTLYAAAADGGDSGYVFNKQVFYTWPETMTRVVPEKGVPGYDDFLGYWSIKRNDSEWNSTAQDWDQLGEVTDTLLIVPRIEGSSYYILGLEGYADLIVAGYDAESQSLYVKEQEFGTYEAEDGDLSFRLCAQIEYQGKVYLWDQGDVIFTAKATPGEKITLTPASSGDYGDFVGMQYYIYYPDEGYGAFHDEGYSLPGEMLWCEVEEEAGGDEPTGEPTSLRKPVKGESKAALRRYTPARVSGERSVNPLTVSKERVAL